MGADAVDVIRASWEIVAGQAVPFEGLTGDDGDFVRGVLLQLVAERDDEPDLQLSFVLNVDVAAHLIGNVLAASNVAFGRAAMADAYTRALLRRDD